MKNNNLFLIYLLGFLFSLQLALPNFINSSYLGTVMSEALLGGVYILAAILAIIGFLFMPKVLARFGNYRIAVTLLIIEILSLTGLVFYNNVISITFFMTCSIVTLVFLSFSFDIFLEGYSANIDTGKIRGTYLTMSNLAWVFAPPLTGLILLNTEYWRVYLSAAVILLPIWLILKTSFSKFIDSDYRIVQLGDTFKRFLQDKNIFNIFMASLLLQIFYSWMTIYVPIYLHSNIGFSWGSIGIIFAVMLLPFILIQFPAGKLADTRYGEKEMLTIGFIIIALSTLVIFFTNSTSVIFWAALLFGTRIGAAMVEVMCDTYFFKKVSNRDANLIGFYRISRPFSYIIGPLLAMTILYFSNSGIQNLFLVLGLMMFMGLKFSLSIEDTK